MPLTLSDADLQQLSRHIEEVPYRHALPLVQFFQSKVNQQQQAEAAKQAEDAAARKVAADLAAEAAARKPNGDGQHLNDNQAEAKEQTTSG